MLRYKISSDFIQLGLLVISGICMLGGFWSYCEAHFATEKDLVAVRHDLTSETEERRELKMEVDALYLRQVPPTDQVKLKFHQDQEGDK